MPTLSRKIRYQQKQGNQQKVRRLKQIQYGRRAEKRAPTPDPNAQGPDSFTEASANQAPAAPAAPPAAPAAPAPTAPTGPTDPFAVSSYNPASGQPDPRGPEYWANHAVLVAKAQQEYGMEQLEQSNADTAFGLRQTEEQEGRRRGVRDTAEGLIGTGLLRSGAHNRRQTEATTDFLARMFGLQSEKTSSDATRGARMAAILQNLGIDERNLYDEATQSYAEREATRAAEEEALAEAAGTGGDMSVTAAPDKVINIKDRKAKQRRMNRKAKSMGLTGKLVPAKKKKKK